MSPLTNEDTERLLLTLGHACDNLHGFDYDRDRGLHVTIHKIPDGLGGVIASNLGHAAELPEPIEDGGSVTSDDFRPEDPFMFMVRVTDRLERAGDPDSFFSRAMAETEFLTTAGHAYPDARRPGLIVFASRDETVAGRCVTVQTAGACVAVTIVDARLIPDHIAVLLLWMRQMLADYDRSYTDATMAMHRIRSVPGPVSFEDAVYALGRSREVARDYLVDKLRRFIRERDICANLLDDDDGTVSDYIPVILGPDLGRLLREAPGPIVVIANANLPDGVFAAASFAGGDAALIALDDVDDHHWSDKVETVRKASFTHARVVIAVAPRAQSPQNRVGLTRVTLTDGHRLVRIKTNGVSIAHIAYVAEQAYLAALNFMNGVDGQDVFGGVAAWTDGACSLESIRRIVERRVARERARRTIADTIAKNLECIKARLWRPEGRLVKGMVRTGTDTSV